MIPLIEKFCLLFNEWQIGTCYVYIVIDEFSVSKQNELHFARKMTFVLRAKWPLFCLETNKQNDLHFAWQLASKMAFILRAKWRSSCVQYDSQFALGKVSTLSNYSPKLSQRLGVDFFFVLLSHHHRVLLPGKNNLGPTDRYAKSPPSSLHNVVFHIFLKCFISSDFIMTCHIYIPVAWQFGVSLYNMITGDYKII